MQHFKTCVTLKNDYLFRLRKQGISSVVLKSLIEKIRQQQQEVLNNKSCYAIEKKNEFFQAVICYAD